MCYHHTYKDQKNCPDERDGHKKICDVELFLEREVSINGTRNNQKNERKQRISTCNEDILEAAFTVKQGCKTPVCNYPQEERYKYTHCLCEDGGVGFVGIYKVAGADCLIEEGNNGYNYVNDSCSERTSLFMLEVPESIEGMEDEVEAIEKLLCEGSLAACSCSSLVDLCSLLKEEGYKNNDTNDENGNEKNVLRDPLFSDLLVGVGPSVGIVSSLVIRKCFLILTVTVKSITDTNVSSVEVGVSLKDLFPVLLSTLCVC